MEQFQICVPSPSAPLLIVVTVVPAADAGWLEVTIRDAIWAGEDPYKLPKWLPEHLEGYADEVEFWPDMASWRRQDSRHPANVNTYRASVRAAR